jgi:hypothetical protein
MPGRVNNPLAHPLATQRHLLSAGKHCEHSLKKHFLFYNQGDQDPKEFKQLCQDHVANQWQRQD